MSTRKTITIAEMAVCNKKEAVLENNGSVLADYGSFNSEPFTHTLCTDEFDLNQINFEKSKEEVQNRVSEKLDEGKVNQYASNILLGDKYPALVIFMKDGEWVVADGFHTLAALLKAGVKKVKNIYMFAHPEAVEISGKFNSVTNGVGENLQETLERATRSYTRKKRECEIAGEPVPHQKDWAHSYRVPVEAFNRHMRMNNTKLFCAKHNVNVDRISHGNSLEAIGRVQQYDEEAAIEIAEMTVNYRLPAKQVETLAKEYLEAPSQAKKQAVLVNTNNRLRIQTNNGKQGVRVKRTPELVVRELVTTLTNRIKKLDHDKFRRMMSNPKAKQEALELAKYLANACR